MNPIRLHDRRRRAWMITVTLVALLCAQIFPLHLHGPHDHHASFDQDAAQDGHEHHAEIHLTASGAMDEAHGLATEIDLSAAAVLKNLKSGDVPVAVLAFFVVLLVLLPAGALGWSVFLESPFTTRGIAFRPPLRAPPL